VIPEMNPDPPVNGPGYNAQESTIARPAWGGSSQCFEKSTHLCAAFTMVEGDSTSGMYDHRALAAVTQAVATTFDVFTAHLEQACTVKSGGTSKCLFPEIFVNPDHPDVVSRNPYRLIVIFRQVKDSIGAAPGGTAAMMLKKLELAVEDLKTMTDLSHGTGQAPEGAQL